MDCPAQVHMYVEQTIPFCLIYHIPMHGKSICSVLQTPQNIVFEMLFCDA